MIFSFIPDWRLNKSNISKLCYNIILWKRWLYAKFLKCDFFAYGTQVPWTHSFRQWDCHGLWEGWSSLELKETEDNFWYQELLRLGRLLQEICGGFCRICCLDDQADPKGHSIHLKRWVREIFQWVDEEARYSSCSDHTRARIWIFDVLWCIWSSARMHLDVEWQGFWFSIAKGPWE